MSCIVTNILSSTLGLLWNKVGDSTTKNFKLQDEDITDSKIREFLVTELLNIKTTFHDLSPIDLVNSYTLLQEGVDALNAALNEPNLEEKALTKGTQDGGETSTSGSNVFNEFLKLSHAVSKIKLSSYKELEVAKKRFENACKKATEALSIVNTSVEDKIVATKLRIVSEILESLDNPEDAIAGCLSVLKKLHSLPAIQELFNAYTLNENPESLTTKCVENVKSVMLINFVLFEYVLKFSSKSPSLCWPTIELDDRSLNPILHWMLISERTCMGKDLDQQPGRYCIGYEMQPYYVTMNSRSEAIYLDYNTINVVSRTGERIKKIELPVPKEFENAVVHSVKGLAVDVNDKVYLMTGLTTFEDTKRCTLCVFNENYSIIHTGSLDYLKVVDDPDLCSKIVINTNNDIIISQENDPYVYICDNLGQLKHKFETKDCEGRPILCISESNEIIITRDCSEELEIYSKEGKLKAKLNVPEDHSILSVAFHYVMHKVVVLTRDYDTSHYLCLYSESGELETTALIRDDFGWCPGVTSHPSGPFAVATSYHIRFIY